jgi:four helix bundle protein
VLPTTPGHHVGMTAHERFDAWKLAHRLALELYRVTEGWPKSERYELTVQVRRAALSVPANIAEGAAKRGSREFRRYLDVSIGSLAEISYYLFFARERGLLTYKDWEELEELRNRVGQLTWRLSRSLTQSIRT